MRTALAVLVVAGCLSIGLTRPVQAATGINHTINFQGKVVNVDGTNVADASYSFKFRIYTGGSGDTASPCANTCIWEETKNLTTVNGIFQTNLGDTTVLPGAVNFNTDNLYLAVVFNGDTEMTPRIRLSAVPYAFNADMLDGLDSSALVQLSPAAQQTGSINVSGNISSGATMVAATSLQAPLLDTATSTALNIGTTNASAINLNQSTTLSSGKTLAVNGTSTFKVSSNFALQVQNSAATAILNVDTLDGYVGVATGSTLPAYTLDVNGSVGVTGDINLANGRTRNIQVVAAASGTGNDLALTAGAAGTSGSNGGNVVLSGGAGNGSGARGVILMNTPAFSTTTNTSCSTSCTIAQSNIDNNSAIIVTATAANLTITMPDPTNLTAGRVVYITGGNGSSDFTLAVNAGATLVDIAMRQNSTATMIWNGADWTAAGASSSTTLQSAYDNTLASAGGAEIQLNNTASSNGLTIRNSTTNPIMGPVFEVQSSIGTELLSVNNNATEYAANGGAETSATFSSNWAGSGGASVFRNTTLSNVATGQAAVEVDTSAASLAGVRNNLTTALSTSTTYQVSFTGLLSSGTFTALQVDYSRDGGSNFATCGSYSTQTLVTTGWSKVTCTFTTDTTAGVSPMLFIRQTDAVARTFYIDNLSVTLNTSTSSPANVQVGGGVYGGNVTLFTLDRSSSPPVANGNDVYYGSMYYDTTSGRIQCYQANGWGACGSAPDTFINLVPEYGGAVLNGTGIGTMTADFCSNQSGVLAVNSTLCGSGQALNYYKWTSPQATLQTYSIYISYQLPGGFKDFQSDSTVQLTARTDNTTNGAVSYQMFRSESGVVSACGSETQVTSTANTWQTVGINGNEASGCGFSKTSANNFAIFKINVKAMSNANVYVGTLSFTITNQ